MKEVINQIEKILEENSKLRSEKEDLERRLYFKQDFITILLARDNINEEITTNQKKIIDRLSRKIQKLKAELKKDQNEDLSNKILNLTTKHCNKQYCKFNCKENCVIRKIEGVLSSEK